MKMLLALVLGLAPLAAAAEDRWMTIPAPPPHAAGRSEGMVAVNGI